MVGWLFRKTDSDGHASGIRPLDSRREKFKVNDPVGFPLGVVDLKDLVHSDFLHPISCEHGRFSPMSRDSNNVVCSCGGLRKTDA